MRQFILCKVLLVFLIVFLLPACTVYTEKRSEALSQAVRATADSIEVARFDLASHYSKQAERLAFPPKRVIPITPIITKDVKQLEASAPVTTPIKQSSGQTITSNIINKTDNNGEQETVLRLVVPERLKHAKLLIENSEEWKELLQTKDFAEQLEKDNEELQRLVGAIDAELQKQLKYNNQLIADLNKLQKQVVEKDLHILKLYIVIALLIGTVGGGVYLRMKGIL